MVPNISVVFTCKSRRDLTELCLRRFKELMPEPYELIICYDGKDPFYERMLLDVGNPRFIIDNLSGRNRWELLNDALSCADGPYFMHLENDFYWVDPTCLDSAIQALNNYNVDFVRFELLPFQINQFDRFEQVLNHDICWMRPTTPYKFTFNPSIRKFKFPGGHLLQTSGFTKQPEQCFNDEYHGTSVCMSGNNFRHLGIYDEHGFPKFNYMERFFNKRQHLLGIINTDNLIEEFNKLTNNSLYRKLFKDYIAENL